MAGSQRRQQLLDVARQAFARGGYRGTTALAISREAGVSEKLVLKHFGTKEGIFRAAVLEPLLELFRHENTQARLRIDAGTIDTPEQAFRRVHGFLSTWARHVREQGPLLLSFLAELRDFPDVADKLLALIDVQVDQAVETLDRAADQSGSQVCDTRVAVQAALGAATVAAVMSDDPDAFLAEYLKLTLFGVLSDDARAHARADLLPTAPDDQ